MQEVVKAVIYKNDKFLLQLRDNIPDISYPNTWAFFGGGVDEGESHKDALKRELKEELSWNPKEFKYLNNIKNETVNCYITHYLIHCRVLESQLTLGEGQALGWFNLEEVSHLNTTDEIEFVIKFAKNYIKGQ